MVWRGDNERGVQLWASMSVRDEDVVCRGANQGFYANQGAQVDVRINSPI